jgi:hypothetical protein
MKPSNVWSLTNVLLLAQLRARRLDPHPHWYRTPSGLLKINALLLVVLFGVSYGVMRDVPHSLLLQYGSLITQALSLVPIVTFSFVILYSILFVIGDVSQFTTTEVVNYLPISSTEYVLASTLSTVLMYFFILTAIAAITLAISIPLGILTAWAVAMVFSAFFMVLGGIVGEIIRALVNRVSSSFSKRGGRSAIFSRAVVIILVILLIQIFFNPNLLFRILQFFAPQIGGLWFVPLLWPSMVVSGILTGSISNVVIFSALTVVLGAALMILAVFLRSRYWVAQPVTIKLGGSKPGEYRSTGFLGRLGFSQAEAALVIKDSRSLFRRKEMVRYLAVPVVMVVVFFLSLSSTASGTDSADVFLYSSAPICLLGAAMFGFFISITSFGQEGKAIWNIYVTPLNPRSLLKAKIAMPLMVSMVPAVILPLLVTLIFGLGPFVMLALEVSTLLITTIAVIVGGLFGPRYMDLEEKPRNAFVTGTGMLFGFITVVMISLVCISPLAFYVLLRDMVIATGFNKFFALGISVAISLASIAALYWVASSSVEQVTREMPFM